MGKKGVGRQHTARKDVSGGCVWRTPKLPTSSPGTGSDITRPQPNPNPWVKSSVPDIGAEALVQVQMYPEPGSLEVGRGSRGTEKPEEGSTQDWIPTNFPVPWVTLSLSLLFQNLPTAPPPLPLLHHTLPISSHSSVATFYLLRQTMSLYPLSPLP
jgi:hypothetical protein